MRGLEILVISEFVPDGQGILVTRLEMQALSVGCSQSMFATEMGSQSTDSKQPIVVFPLSRGTWEVGQAVQHNSMMKNWGCLSPHFVEKQGRSPDSGFGGPPYIRHYSSLS